MEDGSSSSPALTVAEAMRKYGHLLTIYEKKEIEGYKAIYYVGQSCTKKIKAPTSGPNDGFDNDEGEYHFVPDDHIAYRYQIDCLLGVGAFGQVLRARDHMTNTFVAVKFIRNKKKIAQQSKEEISILQQINDKDEHDRYGLVRMHEHFVFRNHVCIVYELLGENLYDEMKANDFFPMSIVEVRTVAARLLVSLTFLWRENIIHADLKPENVLRKCNNSTVVKVADLGSACFDGKIQYSYIQSRFYRAPEIILGNLYGKPIDLWSYACILCELATGYPLFPGENERDQLACIMEYLDVPPKALVDRSRRKQTFFAADGTPKIEPTTKGRLREPGARKIHKFLGLDPDDLFVSFLEQFLVWDPNDRVPPREAMKHPWIREEFVFDRSQVPPAPPVGHPPPRPMMTGERPARPAAPAPNAVPGASAPTANDNNDKEKPQAAAEQGDDGVSNSTTRLKRPAVAANKARSLQVPVVIPEQAPGNPQDRGHALPTLTQPVSHQENSTAVPTAARRGSVDPASASAAVEAPSGRVASLVQRLEKAAPSPTAARTNGLSKGASALPRNQLRRASAEPPRSAGEPTMRGRSLLSEPSPKAPATAGVSRVVPAVRAAGTQGLGNNNNNKPNSNGGSPASKTLRTSGTTAATAVTESISRDSAIVRRSNSPFYAPSAFNSPSDTVHTGVFERSSPPPQRQLPPPPSLESKNFVGTRKERRVDLRTGNGTGVLVKELSPGTRRRAQARAQHRISDAAVAPDMSDAMPAKTVLPTIR